MRRYYFCDVLVMTMLFIFLWGDCSVATGPSVAAIEIVPITYTAHNVILFKTRYDINRRGITGLTKVEYGWLVVSASGIWEEYPDMMFDPEEFQNDPQKMIKESRLRENEFINPFNWVSPPATVQSVLKKYNFQQRRLNLADNHENVLLSIKDRVKTCDRCLKVQSVQNLSTFLTEDDPINIIFYHGGVVLIENVRNESKDVGADFEVPYFMCLADDRICRDYGIDVQAIDGILILLQD